MNVNDLAHLTEELLERLLASDDIENATAAASRRSVRTVLQAAARRDHHFGCLRQGRDRGATDDELYRMNEPMLLDAD